ncbi:hypothetical protein RchiOBHm_Chr4g0438221 [Rosa chinensis]|uniref:Uncharacterized protein n=1 Tax=Rosa chinensis TaxID=74649 RepID=A0A2P6R2H4_ROSCH|nr:hypothetical protein RchiOBHm_Chr4g0438221 [Rosa chinensis]
MKLRQKNLQWSKNKFYRPTKTSHPPTKASPLQMTLPRFITRLGSERSLQPD